MIIKKRRSLYLGLLIFGVLMVITICGSSQAKANNNSIYEYPDHKKLSNGYVFKTKKSDKGLRAYIIKKGRKSRVMATKYFRKKGDGYTEMFYATKHKRLDCCWGRLSCFTRLVVLSAPGWAGFSDPTASTCCYG